jgi:hypothetical protein
MSASDRPDPVERATEALYATAAGLQSRQRSRRAEAFRAELAPPRGMGMGMGVGMGAGLSRADWARLRGARFGARDSWSREADNDSPVVLLRRGGATAAFVAFWQELLRADLTVPTAGDALCALAHVTDDLRPHLDAWRGNPLAHARRHLADFWSENGSAVTTRGVLASAHWTARPDQMRQALAWLREASTVAAIAPALGDYYRDLFDDPALASDAVAVELARLRATIA